MAKLRRTLTDEFLTQCPLRDRDKVIAWAKARQRGFRTSEWADIATGRPARATSVVTVLDALLHEDNAELPSAVALKRFLQERTIDPKVARRHEVIDAISVADSEPFEEGVPAIEKMFERDEHPTAGVRPCKDEAEVRAVTQWLFEDGGRRVGERRYTSSQAIRRAEEFVKMTFEEYADRVVRWHKDVPWSVVVLETKRGPSAMSITAPITEAMYGDLRCGRTNMYRTELNPYCQRSRWLFAEAFAVNPAIYRNPHPVGMGWLFKIAVTHQARLSDVEGSRERVPIHIITTACEKRIVRVLWLFGYKALLTKMPGPEFKLCERIIWSPTDRKKEIWARGVWVSLQEDFRNSFG